MDKQEAKKKLEEAERHLKRVNNYLKFSPLLIFICPIIIMLVGNVIFNLHLEESPKIWWLFIASINISLIPLLGVSARYLKGTIIGQLNIRVIIDLWFSDGVSKIEMINVALEQLENMGYKVTVKEDKDDRARDK